MSVSLATPPKYLIFSIDICHFISYITICVNIPGINLFVLMLKYIIYEKHNENINC